MLKIECQVQITSIFNDSPSISFEEVFFDPQQQLLFLPAQAIKQLDLLPLDPRHCVIAGVVRSLKRYAGVRLRIDERICSIDVLEVPDLELPILGTIPLAMLDFVVDHEHCCLVGNPEHDGEERHDFLLQSS